MSVGWASSMLQRCYWKFISKIFFKLGTLAVSSLLKNCFKVETVFASGTSRFLSITSASIILWCYWHATRRIGLILLNYPFCTWLHVPRHPLSPPPTPRIKCLSFQKKTRNIKEKTRVRVLCKAHFRCQVEMIGPRC